MPREKSLGSSTHRFMRVWGNREQYIANEQMAEHCGKYHFTNCYIGHQIVPTFSKNSQSEHSQIGSEMRGQHKCQTLLFKLFLEPKLFLPINLIQLWSQKNILILAAFWEKGPKGSKLVQCLNHAIYIIHTYIGQIYKSGFSSLLMLLAAESLFAASSKTGFIPLGLFLLFAIWWLQFQIILCDFHTPYYKEESHQILADNVQFASWLK